MLFLNLLDLELTVFDILISFFLFNFDASFFSDLLLSVVLVDLVLLLQFMKILLEVPKFIFFRLALIFLSLYLKGDLLKLAVLMNMGVDYVLLLNEEFLKVYVEMLDLVSNLFVFLIEPCGFLLLFDVFFLEVENLLLAGLCNVLSLLNGFSKLLVLLNELLDLVFTSIDVLLGFFHPALVFLDLRQKSVTLFLLGLLQVSFLLGF